MSESLAVRHRPRRFADVAGQRHVVAVLRAAAAAKRPPHQLLLAGPSGTGKTTLARIFAAALFCPTPADNGDACGACQTCVDVTGPGGRHPDVIELDAASHGGIDQIREIGSAAHIAPMNAPWKLYIIDEAHGLTAAGGQAALRLIEEPPAHTLFALATTDPDKLPTALRGRCQQLEVLPPTRTELRENLDRICHVERWQVQGEIVEAILDVADPALGVRGTVMLLEKLANHIEPGKPLDPDLAGTILGTANPALFAELVGFIEEGSRPAALRCVARMLESATAPVVRAQLSSWARSQLHKQVATGGGEATALHWYSTITHEPTFAGGLELSVAKMTSPHLSADPFALEALVVRAERALTALSNGRTSPTQPDTSPEPHAATAPDPAADHGENEPTTVPVRDLEPRAESNDANRTRDADHDGVATPAQVGRAVMVTLPDTQLAALMNQVGKGAPKAALILRRSQVWRDGLHWTVTLSAADVDAAAEIGFAERLRTAAQGSGATVTVT